MKNVFRKRSLHKLNGYVLVMKLKVCYFEENISLKKQHSLPNYYQNKISITPLKPWILLYLCKNIPFPIIVKIKLYFYVAGLTLILSLICEGLHEINKG